MSTRVFRAAGGSTATLFDDAIVEKEGLRRRPGSPHSQRRAGCRRAPSAVRDIRRAERGRGAGPGGSGRRAAAPRCLARERPLLAWISPRYTLLHAFAHLLINRRTDEAGYSSASLRERLYVSTDRQAPMAGVLIYTAAGDSDGTRGGLVRLGRPEHLGRLIEEALARGLLVLSRPCLCGARRGRWARAGLLQSRRLSQLCAPPRDSV